MNEPNGKNRPYSHLCMTLKEGEWIVLGDDLRILVKEVGRKRRTAVQLLFIAPRELPIYRAKADKLKPSEPSSDT